MKISVIIPCYNVENYILRCLKSIENQTFGIENLQLILIDDASTDNTREYLLQFEAKYPDNVIVVINEKNENVGRTRNIGIMYASEKYISFVDSDDVIDADFFSKTYDAILKYDCDMVECNYLTFSDENSICVQHEDECKIWDLTDIRTRRQFIIDEGVKTAVWGRLYKKEIIDNNSLRFLEKSCYEDMHFSGMGMLLMNKVCYLKDTLYYYFVNPAGITNKPNISKLQQEIDSMNAFLVELNSRQLFSDAFETMYDEMCYYCTLKAYLDPVVMLIRYNDSDWRKNALIFKNYVKKLFPNIGNNKYLRRYMEYSEVTKCIGELLIG